MIYNTNTLKNVDIQTTNNDDSVNMRLSDDATTMVFQLFTKNVYSNPIGTIVREITSNCFDSHIEANVDLPVVIRLTTDIENHKYISFIDYGVGMSPDRINNIYGVYFESTKRVDNGQHGGYGIGGKTPLAYKRKTGHGDNEYDNSFYIVTVYNNIKYTYLIYEGQKSPIITLLHQEETTDGNGTEVKIPVLEKDISQFVKEFKFQLYYFENLIFEGFENFNSKINDYTIIKGENFMYRESNNHPFNVIHVCLGRVAYPINYDILDISSYNHSLPIAIKLNIGDIGVTVSRENIDYSESTIAFLKNKINDAINEIVGLLDEQNSYIDNFNSYFENYNNLHYLTFKNTNIRLYCYDIFRNKNMKFTLKNFKHFDFINKHYRALDIFFTGHRISGNRCLKKHHTLEFLTLKQHSCYYFNDINLNHEKHKQAYLKYLHHSRTHITKNPISKIKTDIESTLTDKELLEIQDLLFDVIKQHSQSYEDIIIPPNYKPKKEKKVYDPKNKEVIFKLYTGKSTQREKIRFNTLINSNINIYYGSELDTYKLYNLSSIYRNFIKGNMIKSIYNVFDNSPSKTIMFVEFNKSTLKLIDKLKNANHIDKFFDNELKHHEEFVSDYFTYHNMITKYNEIPHFFKNEKIVKINKNFGEKIKKINKLVKEIPSEFKEIDSNLTIINAVKLYFQPKCSNKYNKSIKMIDDVINISNKNKKYLDYINNYSSIYYSNSNNQTLLNILSRVLIFDENL